MASAPSGLSAILSDIGAVSGTISSIANTGAAQVYQLPSNLGGAQSPYTSVQPFGGGVFGGSMNWGVILAIAAAGILLVIVLRRRK